MLDPTGAGNGPEIVYVTAHTGSATSATIVRGREGTSGVQHASTITWVHVATAADYALIGDDNDQPSTGGLPYEGEKYIDTTNDRTQHYSGSAWVRTGWYSSTGRTGWSVRRASNQSVSSGSATSISWDTEDYDSDSYISVTGTTVTIPANLGGIYVLTFQIETGFPSNSSEAKMSIVTTDATYANGWLSRDARGTLTIVAPLDATDTVYCQVLQSVGGAANFTGRFHGYRIGA